MGKNVYIQNAINIIIYIFFLLIVLMARHYVMNKVYSYKYCVKTIEIPRNQSRVTIKTQNPKYKTIT